MPSIFLSYARDDDEPFVKRLYQDLIAHGFEVWWDRVSMPSRQLTFHQEIRDAIKVRDRVVLVVGPHAVTSDYVNQEWQWALEMGKCINPIIRLNGRQESGGLIDGFVLLPEQLKLVHAEDFRDDSSYKDHLANLERQLSDPPPPLGKLIAVPTLPAHYRAQPERLRQLRDILLVDLQKPIVISGAVARVGVQGMGGIGKSVLAAALARDPEVRRVFPNGIFWIGIWQHPNLVEIQRQTVKLLGGDPVFEDIHTGKTRLRELLEHRAVLLILDDVWQATDADAFDVVGLRSKLLLTTRDSGLVTSFTGMSYQVQLPSMSEAYALLTTAARIPIEALPPIAEEIIDECGRLPLALALCGSMASKGQTWERILRMLREARLELIADRQEINEMHRSIWRAMEASVSILNPEEQRRFAELAVFSFDTTVPEVAIFTLWYHTGGLDDLAASDLLISFYERSLVLIDRPAGSTGTANARVSLHDLLFDYATRIAIQFLGDIAVLHNQLVDAYWQKCPDGWPSGPDDGYFLQYLCHHLFAAGKHDQIVPLLLNPDVIRIKRLKLGYYILAREYEWQEKCINLFLTDFERKLLKEISSSVRILSGFFGREYETKQVELFLESAEKKHLVILGPAGMGKTVFLLHIWLGDIRSRMLISPQGSHNFWLNVISSSYEQQFGRIPNSSERVDGFQYFLTQYPNIKCLIVDDINELQGIWDAIDCPLLNGIPLKIIWGTRPREDIINFFGDDAYYMHLPPLADKDIQKLHEWFAKISEQ